MNIAISGASGLVGRRLLKALAAQGHSLHVWSRHAGTNLPPGISISSWDPVKGEPPAADLRTAEAVIHLAGEPVAQRWTAEARRRIRDSRVIGTRNLVRALGRLEHPPKVLICASAVGYYGSRGDEVLVESSPPGAGFLSDVCMEWEQEAQGAESCGVRVVRARLGMVLDARGGALRKMLPPFRLGVGGRIGDGRHWMSWIHVEDLVGLLTLALSAPLAGAVNAVAPAPVTNAGFTRALAASLHRPAFLPVPPVALRLLFGQMSEVVLASQRAVPEAARRAGYAFRFPEIGPALANVLQQGRGV
jgi:uncharacterized protein (TIGR01777 family)